MKIIPSENDIYLQETEVKPNRYAAIILVACVFTVLFCAFLTEVGIFRVGLTEIRIGSAFTFLSSAVPLCALLFFPSTRSNKMTKFFILGAMSVFTLAVGTFLTFHTTILMIFPILFAMLYRSKPIGIFATISSLTCTALCPILGYILGTWDIALFQELILIGTNGTAVIEGAYDGLSWLNIGKILLYLVLPHLLMVGSCTMLLFYVIRISVAHVENQVLLNTLSRRDSVTGLFNRNCFEEVMEGSERSPSGDTPVAVLFYDVNDLKIANDSRGHEYGDTLLTRCAESILRVVDEDTSYGFRVGGDEFAILLFAPSEADVLKKIGEWKQSILDINAKYSPEDPDGVRCSMPVGYAFGTFAERDALLKLADSRMYKEKAAMKAAMKAGQ